MATLADQQHLSQPARPARPWPRVRRVAPTALVIASLAAIAAWGHYSDWTIPKFSQLTGGADQAAADWCVTHNVPESVCVECDAKLLAGEKSFGWCKTHGIADCPLEHPEIAELGQTPTIGDEDRARAARALAVRPRAENNSRCQVNRRHIQFASVAAVEKAGVDIAVAEERPLTETITANGEVVYDPTRLARLSSRAAGAIWQVEKKVGDRVHRGEIIALVDAFEVGKAKSDLLQAITQVQLHRKTVSRLSTLASTGSVPARQLQEAETALKESEVRVLSAQQALVNLGLPAKADDLEGLPTDEMARRIQFLGLPSDLVASFDTATTTSNLLPIASPLVGVVVQRSAVAGEVVDPKTLLFEVADTSRLRLTLAVRQEDARFLKLGQQARFTSSESTGETVAGEISWISPAIEHQTRTVEVFVELDNAAGRLRANTFGTGRILLREEPKAIVVPSEAVHQDGDCAIVFVRDRNWFKEGAPKFFHVRQVRVGAREGGTTEIIAGLLPGEVIASHNSNVLEAQLLKSNLGAGCCEGH